MIVVSMFRVARPRPVVPGPRYRLLESVGDGLLGSVWQAEDSLTGRPVTVRVLHEALGRDPSLMQRIGSEINALTRPALVDGKLTQRLSQQNILRVIHFQPPEADRPALIVMEPQRGELLADVLAARGQPEAGLVARIGSQLAGALETAHRAGLVHGAPHPGSVLVTPRRQTLLMDFGVMAALLSSEASPDLFQPLSPFIAPEYVAGGEPTPASDVYALGALLVTMLTGRHPTEQVEGPNVSDVLARVCEQTLATDPEARPAAADVRSALEAVRADLQSQVGPPPGGSDVDHPVRGTAAENAEAILPLETGSEAVVDLPLSDPRSPWTAETSLRHMARSREARPPAGRGSPIQTSAPPHVDPHPADQLIRRGISAPASSTGQASLHAQSSVPIWHLLGVFERRLARGTSRHQAMWYVSATAVVLVTMLLLGRSLGEKQSPTPRGDNKATPASSQVGPSLSSTESIVIPPLVGMTAFDAHERLAEAGLMVASAQPVKGTPGIVIRTYPGPGVHVAPGTAVTLFVGAPPGRLQDSG
jgi:serine/threonine protein kinase